MPVNLEVVLYDVILEMNRVIEKEKQPRSNKQYNDNDRGKVGESRGCLENYMGRAMCLSLFIP
jgi:hypothetical protein